MRLFDSSAIIVLLGQNRIDTLLEGWTINLAFYELGNAVWKQATIQRSITMDEADKVLDSLTKIFKRLKKPETQDASEILKIAVEEHLTYYDASYVQAAAKNGLTLVTDDDKLLRRAKKYTRTTASQQLQ